MATQAELYKPYDEYSAALKRKVKQEFNRILLAGFDELNVIQAKKTTQVIWERIDRFIRKHLRELYGWVYEWVYVLYGKEPPDRDWTKAVDDWLKGYDPVTRYVYATELERKRLRLTEEILTAREYQDRPGLEQTVKTAAGLLLTQGLQYGLDLMGEAEKRAYEEVAEDAYVKYNACDDDRTCGDCWQYNGKVFPIDAAPRIPQHYRCRCWYTPAAKPEEE